MGNVGDSPGTIRIAENSLKPVIHIYSYNTQECLESKGNDISVILHQLKKCTEHTHWIKINGLGDADLFEQLGELMNINKLVLEDITNLHQRPKYDEYEGYIFVTSRIIKLTSSKELSNTQFSAIVKDNIILSFEETYDKHFESVEGRLQAGKGIIRTGGPGYMCYALTDTIIDEYFVILADIGDSLDEVEDRLYASADKSIMYDAQHLKRATILMRRACWPERDKINDMLRSDSPLITAEVKPFLRDAYDHCIQIMDLVESYKEITSSIIDLYLSMVSNRMNEIMKVLTIISVIFIPLTFIAGIYGMNFSREDPVTHRVMPANMPELYSPHGYVYVIGAMLLVAILQIVFFWRKGWFKNL
ncbi:magnesium/cobalt transporter CorA [Mucilaginibacter koreensis]